jgi:hypothetical protein
MPKKRVKMTEEENYNSKTLPRYEKYGYSCIYLQIKPDISVGFVSCVGNYFYSEAGRN